MTTPREVAAALARVVDPEIGIDVVTLGLIYGIDVVGDDVGVAMATTSAACPMSNLLLEGAARAVATLGPGLKVRIEHVTEPPWDPAMMDPRALGFRG